MSVNNFKIGLSNADKSKIATDTLDTVLNGDLSVSGETTNVTKKIKEINEAVKTIENKAEVDGKYPLMGVGLSDNLASPDGFEVDEAFSFRDTAGDRSIMPGAKEEGDYETIAEIQEIRGNTLIVNQLVKNGNFATSEEWKITTTGSTHTWETNKLTIKTTKTGGDWTAVYQYINGLQLNSQYYLKIKCTKSSNCSLRLRYPQILPISDNTEYIVIGSEVSQGSLFFQVQSTDGQEATLELTEIALVNNTQMFGAGKEPSTIAEFNNLTRNLDTETYNEGERVNSELTAFKTVGFNAFNGELEQGTINETTGQLETDSRYFRSKNYIQVVCGSTYSWYETFAALSDYWQKILFEFDKEHNLLNVGKQQGQNRFNTALEYTLKPNTCYVKIVYYKGNGNWVDNPQICFHLTHTGYRNGQYEPYWEETRQIDTVKYFPEGMKSAGNAYDYMTPDKAVKVVGSVDLETLEITVSDSSIGKITIYLPHKEPVWRQPINATCSKYTASFEEVDKSIVNANANYINIIDSDFIGKTAIEVKQSLSGVILNYELATHIETPIDEPLNFAIKVDDFGTEEQLGNGLAKLNIRYTPNLRDFIRNVGLREDINYDASNIASTQQLNEHDLWRYLIEITTNNDSTPSKLTVILKKTHAESYLSSYSSLLSAYMSGNIVAIYPTNVGRYPVCLNQDTIKYFDVFTEKGVTMKYGFTSATITVKTSMPI